MENGTKLQSVWLIAAYFAECDRCAKTEELIFTRDFLVRAGNITRWQKHHQALLEELITDGEIIVDKRGHAHRSRDFYRLSEKARKSLAGMFAALKKESWIAGYQTSFLAFDESQSSNIWTSGESPS